MSSLMAATPALGQRVQATVTFHVDKLPQEEKEYLAGLDKALSQVVEQFQWNDGRRRWPLPVQYELFFVKAARSGIYHRFVAGVLVGLKSGLQLKDKRCEFRYLQEDRVHLGDPYDPLSGVIEFYTWICIGFEADRLSPLGGAPYYERAKAVGEAARSEAQLSLGWDDRRAFASDLTDSTYAHIRRARFHTEAGAYYRAAGNGTAAESNLAQAVNLLLKCPVSLAELRRDDHIIRFVDLDRLAAALKAAEMEKELEKLARWDSDRADRYR